MKVVMNMEQVKKKERTVADKRYLTKRLNTIEGQVRGVTNMVAEDRYCDDILIQIAAVCNSLRSVAKDILRNHLNTCVVKNIKEDNLEILDEVMALFERLK